MSLDERWFHGALREMARSECLELLASRPVGRVAYCDEAGPVLLPVNHVMDGEDVIFRTSPHSELAQQLREGPAASFQVDDFDEFNRSGWSVLLRGVAGFVQDDELPAAVSAGATPWPEGVRHLHVRITPRAITGRRLLAS